MHWKDAKLYTIKPNRQHRRKTKADYIRSHKAQQHMRDKEQKALRHLAIRLLLGLKGNATINEQHIECAEKKLRLPVLRLYLNRPDPPFSQRIARIYRALQKRA